MFYPTHTWPLHEADGLVGLSFLKRLALHLKHIDSFIAQKRTGIAEEIKHLSVKCMLKVRSVSYLARDK